jgi:phosphonate transport system substrate-binding protein
MRPLNAALVLTFAATLLTVVPGSGLAYTPDVLKVSAIPDENPTELMRIYAPFAEYLGKQIGMRDQEDRHQQGGGVLDNPAVR